MSLQLRRLRISAGGQVAFDERFVHGVNVIDGENSSGKSTLFKLLYFAMGGALANQQWTDAALKCDRVFLECKVGEAILTLSRAVEGKPTTPMLVLNGDMDYALDGASIDEWLEYPYSRSDNKQSISQLLFSMLKWPEAFSDEGDFVTMSQFLRAHYADQESPNNTVLRYEDQFDKPTTRETIGNFLLGGIENRLAQRERELRELEGDYARASGSASAGTQLIGGEFDELNLPSLDKRQAEYEAELALLETQSNELMRTALRPIRSGDVDRKRLDEITDQISSIKSKISGQRQDLSQIRYDILDSDLFIATITSRIRYLTEASAAATEFGPVAIDFCPACGTSVAQVDEPGHCYLCKASMGDEPPERRFFSMVNSAQGQVEQSRRLQKNRVANAQKLEQSLTKLNRELDASAVELEQQQAAVISTQQAELASIQSRIGFIRSELERLRRDRSIIERLQKLRDRRDELAARIAALREEIEALRSSSNIRVANALARVSKETLAFLHADLERQDGFHQSENVEIDYRNNRFSLDNVKALSASSTSYMRNSIFLAGLFAANSTKSMRHLEILMLENLEDKGMEPERYHNLHRSIVERSSLLSGEWQIFVATADWNSEIEGGFVRIGPRYTHDRRTLRLPAKIK